MSYCNPLFIGHGSPMNAIETNRYTRFLNDYGAAMKRPRAVVVISAHWETDGTRVTGAENPHQIYDFGGFPRELRSLVYSPKGDPELANSLVEMIPEIAIDSQRGIDHGAWSIVKNLFPRADIPLIQISLDRHKSPRDLIAFGAKLAPLAHENVLFIGSGNMIHNLRDISYETETPPFAWAVEIDRWFQEKIEQCAIEDLCDFRQKLPNYLRAVPTNEHLFPLFVILGMRQNDQPIQTIFDEIQNGSIAMRSIAVLSTHE